MIAQSHFPSKAPQPNPRGRDPLSAPNTHSHPVEARSISLGRRFEPVEADPWR